MDFWRKCGKIWSIFLQTVFKELKRISSYIKVNISLPKLIFRETYDLQAAQFRWSSFIFLIIMLIMIFF